jgi:hypothetical protein
MEFTSSMFTSKVNICTFFFPFAINLPWFFMLSINLVPPSHLSRLIFLLWLQHKVHLSSILFAHLGWTMAPCKICVMGCVVSSPVSTNLGVFKSLMSQNHSPWLVMWFEALKITY